MNLPTRALASNLRRLGTLICLSLCLWAQGGGQPGTPPPQLTVTPATAKAINYRNLTGSTTIGFRGTVLRPEARGSAKIIPRPGSALRIKARFEKLQPATTFGSDCLTYVLWAVTPAGRPANLGEVIVRRSGRAELDVNTNLQTFGLVVTAEPHFAVADVSGLVVLENVVTEDTRGQVEEVEAHYELLPRGAYPLEGGPGAAPAPPRNRKVSPYVLQAYNAMRIARAEGADQLAPEEFRKASELMARLEAEPKKWNKPVVVLAREAVQTAEDARLVARKHREEARLEQARREAEAAKAESERTRAQAEAEKLAALRDKQKAEQETQQAREQASQEVSAEKLALRRKLADQLEKILPTRESERGLVVTGPDVKFATGKTVLPPATREKLAKAAGILLAYPGLKVSVEGHADGTGRPDLNLRLSLRRAQAVRDYLVGQGVPPEHLSAIGFGSTRPVTSNDTPLARQQNRRVELLLTGGVIGF
jgi:outer membrane protein OmpA-like peptidoglycan-associated protein